MTDLMVCPGSSDMGHVEGSLESSPFSNFPCLYFVHVHYSCRLSFPFPSLLPLPLLQSLLCFGELLRRDRSSWRAPDRAYVIGDVSSKSSSSHQYAHPHWPSSLISNFKCIILILLRLFQLPLNTQNILKPFAVGLWSPPNIF